MAKKKLLLLIGLVLILVLLICFAMLQINRVQNENGGTYIDKGGCASSKPGTVHPDYCVAPK